MTLQAHCTSVATLENAAEFVRSEILGIGEPSPAHEL